MGLGEVRLRYGLEPSYHNRRFFGGFAPSSRFNGVIKTN